MFTLGTGGHQRQWQKGGVSIYICIRMMPLPLPLPSQNRYPTHSMTMPLPLLLPLPFTPPQCEHPPLDTIQPIHDGKNIILPSPLPLPSLSVNEPLDPPLAITVRIGSHCLVRGHHMALQLGQVHPSIIYANSLIRW